MAATALRRLLPLADRVLVRRVEAAAQTAGGVFLPESAVAKANEGEIVSVGPGATTRDGTVIPMTLKVGDKVLLPEYGGQKVQLDAAAASNPAAPPADNADEGLFLYRHDEILGVFES